MMNMSSFILASLVALYNSVSLSEVQPKNLKTKRRKLRLKGNQIKYKRAVNKIKRLIYVNNFKVR